MARGSDDWDLFLGVLEGELIEGDDFTSSGSNSLSSGLSDSESADSELWDFEESDVVGNGTNNNSGLERNSQRALIQMVD